MKISDDWTLNWRHLIFGALAIALIGSLAYANTIHNPFIWDDQILIKDNEFIRSWGSLGHVMTQDIGQDSRGKFILYRPVQMITYFVDYSLWGYNPIGYHLTNILLHIACALALFSFLILIFKDEIIAFIAGALFVAHPVHTEAVTYIAGRAEPLSTLFMLTALIFYVRRSGSRSIIDSILTVIFYIFAMGAKEYCVIFPAFAILYCAIFKKKIYLSDVILFSFIAASFIALRGMVSSSIFHGFNYTEALHNALERLPGFFVALGEYARLIVAPFGLHMEYGNRLFQWNDHRVYTGITIFLLLIVGFILAKKSTAARFGLAWFLIAIIPISNLYPLNAFMAEHWLYVPFIGIAILFASGVSYLSKMRFLGGIVFSLTILFIGFLSILTFRQNVTWADPVKFYERTISYSPDSPKLYNNLGTEYFNRRDYVRALDAYTEAIKIDPLYGGAYNNAGIIYARMGDHDRAIKLFKNAIRRQPNFGAACRNLGGSYEAIGEWGKAIPMYLQAIATDPADTKASILLAQLYYTRGDIKRADDTLIKAARFKEDAQVYLILGIIASDRAEIKKAADYYLKAISIDSECAEAYCNLASLYASAKDYERAITLFHKALSIDPNSVPAKTNLATCIKERDSAKKL